MAKNQKHNLVKRGEVWYFQKMVQGRWVKKALSTSLSEAKKQRDAILLEIQVNGGYAKQEPRVEGHLFGVVARQWVKIKETKVKSSTLKDYRGAMNHYILPKFGNVPIDRISYMDIEVFISRLKCTNKRKSNILVPVRDLFKMAHRAGYIEKNPMTLVENPRIEKPDIYPLSMDEVNDFIGNVLPYYRNFFIVAFFTGMRFGEMSGLKWQNVDFNLNIIKVRETRVRGEEGVPKTKKSVRDVDILPPVMEALRDQRRKTMGKSEYVFLNKTGCPLLPNSVNFHIWKPTLAKCGLTPRSLYQTRHTFATLMLDAGELPGWVQKMMGHESLQMIHEKYYAHIKNYRRDDGSAFMANVYGPSVADETPEEETMLRKNLTPN
jgi:integrase